MNTADELIREYEMANDTAHAVWFRKIEYRCPNCTYTTDHQYDIIYHMNPTPEQYPVQPITYICRNTEIGRSRTFIEDLPVEMLVRIMKYMEEYTRRQFARTSKNILLIYKTTVKTIKIEAAAGRCKTNFLPCFNLFNVPKTNKPCNRWMVPRRSTLPPEGFRRRRQPADATKEYVYLFRCVCAARYFESAVTPKLYPYWRDGDRGHR